MYVAPTCAEVGAEESSLQGVAGAAAMVVQVLVSFSSNVCRKNAHSSQGPHAATDHDELPVRRLANYDRSHRSLIYASRYRYGGTTVQSTKKLWQDGGFARSVLLAYYEARLIMPRRFYHGLLPALIQGPISRFGDTAANVGILALLSSNPFLNKLPSPIKTVFASVAGALFRMILVPIDTLKTTMQTQGKHGVGILRERVKAYGLGSLWWGAIATAVANFVGSFPWFATVSLPSYYTAKLSERVVTV